MFTLFIFTEQKPTLALTSYSNRGANLSDKSQFGLLG